MEIICPFILLSPCQMTASLSMGRWSLCSPMAPRRSKVWLAQCHAGLEVDAVSFPSRQLYPLLPCHLHLPHCSPFVTRIG